MIISLYDKLKMAGCKIDHHESDLYVEATDTARKIIKEAQREEPSIRMEYFNSQIDGKQWIDVPFHYAPYWIEKQNR